MSKLLSEKIHQAMLEEIKKKSFFERIRDKIRRFFGEFYFELTEEQYIKYLSLSKTKIDYLPPDLQERINEIIDKGEFSQKQLSQALADYVKENF